MKKSLTALGLILFSLLLFALFAEIGIRLFKLTPPAQPTGFFWRSPDPTTGWSLQPNASGRWFNPAYEYDTNVTINERGLRSPDEIGYERPDNTLRILVLGDSHVEALQVPLEDTFPQRLARLLQANADARDDGRTIEVINAGVSGWGTDQQLLWLRQEGVNYRPDVVLLAVYPTNDFMNNSLPLEFANIGSARKPFFDLEDGELTPRNYPFDPQIAAKIAISLQSQKGEDSPTSEPTEAASIGQPSSTPNAAVRLRSSVERTSALYRFLEPRVRTSLPDFAVRLVDWGILEPGQEGSDASMGPDYIPVTYGIYQQPLTDEWKESVALTGKLFEEIAAATAEMDATLFATLLTSAEQVYPEQWDTNLQNYEAMQAREWSLDQPNEFAAALLAVADIPTLDLLPVFRERAETSALLHLRNDGHWTADGHLLAADALSKFLVEQGLLAEDSVEN